MGQSNQNTIPEAVTALQLQRSINPQQAVKFLHDYVSNSERIQDVRTLIQEHQLSIFLKHFIKAHYKEGNQELNEENSAEKNEIVGMIKYMENKIYQRKIKIQELLTNICQITLTKKFHKIRNSSRQNIKKLFNIDQFSLYLWDCSDKIQYYNSKIDFQTEINQSDNHFNYLQSVYSQTIQLNNVFRPNQDVSFHRIFNHNLNVNTSIGISLLLDYKKVILILNFKNDLQYLQYFSNVKSENNQAQILQFSNYVIQLLMMPLSESDELGKLNRYNQKILGLLKLNLFIEKNIVVEKMNKLVLRQKQNNLNISILQKRIIKETKQKKVDELFGIYSNIVKENDLKIDIYLEKLEQKKELFLDFNQYEQLIFICNIFEKSQIATKLVKQWQKGHRKLGDFFENQKKIIENVIKNSKTQLKGLKNQIIIVTQDNIQIQIYLKQHGRLQRVQITLTKTSELSSKSIQFSQQSLSSNHFSEESLKNKRRQSIDNEKIIQKLQTDNPGIMEEGWIGLFLKNNQTVRRTSKFKHKTYNNDNNRRFQSPKLLTSIEGIPVGMQEVNLQSTQLNLLQVQEDKLQALVAKIFCKLQFFRNLPQFKQQFENFLSEVHEHYEIHSNPFHNFIHGVNVMHTAYLISSIPKNKDLLSPIHLFALVFAALCHDIGHTGFTNDFQIATASPKALLYNDRSPLENYHASTTFQVLKKTQNNFLKSLSLKQMDEFRNNVISNILYTDIKEHFPLLKKFQNIISNSNSKQGHKILSGMIIHTSDFAGSSKEFMICREWAQKVNIQFTNQFNMQKQLGLPQTPFMKDLSNIAVLSKNEIGFLRVIVYPLFNIINSFYDNHQKTQRMVHNVDKNIQAWEKIQKDSIIEKIIQQNEENQQQDKLSKKI